MSERATPFYCPYCGEQDLRPAEDTPAAWLCADCRRVFSVRFVGLNLPAAQRQAEVRT